MELLIIVGMIALAATLFAVAYIGEQKETEDWLCYRKKCYKGEAANGYCAGEDGNVRCGHCLYYKQWKRRNIHE